MSDSTKILQAAIEIENLIAEHFGAPRRLEFIKKIGSIAHRIPKSLTVTLTFIRQCRNRVAHEAQSRIDEHLYWQAVDAAKSELVALSTGAGINSSRVVEYGDVIRLLHRATQRWLHSHMAKYTHAGTSGQQQVTCFAGADSNDYWIVKGQHGRDPNVIRGRAVQHADLIRLEHVLTGRNLHSHESVKSPITGQQEVTAFGDAGNGDTNDNWKIEIPSSGSWIVEQGIKLIHQHTDAALHSHVASHPELTSGQNEVTAFSERDNNDWWMSTK